MFELPIIPAEVPRTIKTRLLPPAIARLGYTMANAGMIQPSDLRTGSAGAARMIERTFERWHLEDGSPAMVREMPGNFLVIDATVHRAATLLAKRDSHHAWLIWGPDRAPTRWYVGRATEALIKKGRPDFASHALATLYAGLDAVCYSVKPADFLKWAQLLWWGGHESDKAAKAAGVACGAFPSRRKFDFRYPAHTIAPTRCPAAMERVPAGHKDLARRIAAVETALRSRDLLRPNLPEFNERAALDTFAVFVRAYAGDYMGRLVDDYFHATANGPTAAWHGAWPLATADDVARARRGIAANTKLAAALARLANSLGGVGVNSMGGHW